MSWRMRTITKKRRKTKPNGCVVILAPATIKVTVFKALSLFSMKLSNTQRKLINQKAIEELVRSSANCYVTRNKRH